MKLVILRLLFTALINLSIPLLLYATEQIPDLLISNVDTVNLYSLPFTQLEQRLQRDTSFLNRTCWSTACWRGYQATWEIKNETLYLRKITGCCDKSIQADLALLFGRIAKDNEIVADWFSGRIVVPRGKKIYGEHMGFSTVFEREDIFFVSDGLLTSHKQVDNRKTDIQYLNTNKLSEYVIANLDRKIKKEIESKKLSLDFYVQIESDSSRNVTNVIFTQINEIKYKDDVKEILLSIDDWDVLYRHGEIADLLWHYPVSITWKNIKNRKKRIQTSEFCENRGYVIDVFEELVVYEGDTIDLYTTTFADIFYILGNKVEKISHNGYSFEFVSKKYPISLTYQQSDSARVIKWFNAKLSRSKLTIDGKCVPNKPSVRDIINIFGIGNWSYDAEYEDLLIEYDYFDYGWFLRR